MPKTIVDPYLKKTDEHIVSFNQFEMSLRLTGIIGNDQELKSVNVTERGM